MSTGSIATAGATDMRGLARRVAIAALFTVLVYKAALFASAGLGAIRYRFELDYGEGIVWQQMRWIFTDKAYGAIDQFPAIVFHYTPLYHVVTSLAAGGLGTDELATGRAVSLVSTLVAAAASAVLVDLLLHGRASKADRRLCAGAAGLLAFTYLPVVYWAPLMRVDMLAMALGLLGLVAAFKALERPRLIHLAALLFVGAVYAKQTSIAAPAATFAVLLVARPQLALRGIATCLLVGLVALAALGVLTDGGFYRHIFLYNVNRPDLGRLDWIVEVSAMFAMLIAIAAIALAHSLSGIRNRQLRSGSGLRSWLENHPGDVRVTIAAAYLLFTTLMLLLVAKSGSSINYFLEWFFALGLFGAMALAETAFAGERRGGHPALAIGAPLALALQAFSAPVPPFVTSESARSIESARLSRQVAEADKPVISDDMVLLLRGGQDVVWEPAIFAELASTGVWDERPFVERIRNREFAFLITWGRRGHHRFDERYNPPVADAIDAAYPVKQEIAGLVVHRPTR